MGLQSDSGHYAAHTDGFQTPPSKKRKYESRSTPRGKSSNPIELSDDDDENDIVPAMTTGAKKTKYTEIKTPSKPSKTPTPHRPKKGEEKRLRMWRKHAPQSYLERFERATGQRMFVISRSRNESTEVPEETIELAGTTGNIYSVTIDKTPSCTCPDSLKGNQCKHIIYVLHTVLKAPPELQYQLAFLSSELATILAYAPPLPASSADDDAAADASTSAPSNRKPIEGDCPICFCELDASDANEQLVWCKAACGNNIHKGCFEQWAKSQAGKEVRCVYCRAGWEGDDDSLEKIRRVKKKGKVNREGYYNVASELGMSRSRDFSSYHRPWVVRNGHGGWY